MTELTDFLCARLDEDERDPGGWSEMRVLAEVDAKRRIVAEHADESGECRVCTHPESFADDSEGGREWFRSAMTSPCNTLRLLARMYMHHPDYRPEWLPSV